MQSQFESVGEFHRKFDLRSYDPGRPPTIVEDDVFSFRRKFIEEELQELDSAHVRGDLVGVADALVDVVYVVLGTAHMYGIPFDEVFAEVHRSNMSKERSTGADDPRSTRGNHLDVVKPDGWEPPNVAGILSRFMRVD